MNDTDDKGPDKGKDQEPHTGVRRTLDQAQDVFSAALGEASAALAGGSTSVFVRNAAISDQYEIQAAEIAMRRTRSDRVRRMAEEVLEDHRASADALLEAVAGRTDLEAPQDLDQRRRSMVENLEAAPDEAFDETFLDQQVAAHQEAITLFETYRDTGDEETFKTHAEATLAFLERHLRHAQEIRAEQ